MRAAVLALAGLTATAVSCSSRSGSAPRPTYGALSAGEVARVGGVGIDAPLVTAVAAAEGTDARAAVASLIEDALAAEGARAERLDGAPGPAWASAVALARRIPLALARDARAGGPPTDDELATVSVAHAVVLRTHSVDASRGLVVARAIADAVAGARDETDFQERAAAASKGVRTSIQTLPAFDAAGLGEDGNQVDPDFVAGAFALRAPGDTSPIVETPFGWHVIRLIARTLPTGADLDARRAEVAPVIEGLRARMRLADVLRTRRSSTRVEISAAAEELMSRAETAPP
jgi:hypothetical protein